MNLQMVNLIDPVLAETIQRLSSLKKETNNEFTTEETAMLEKIKQEIFKIRARLGS